MVGNRRRMRFSLNDENRAKITSGERLCLVSLLSDVSYVIQHEKDADTVLICHESKCWNQPWTTQTDSCLDNITVVSSQGKPRTSKRTVSELHFDCEVRSLGRHRSLFDYLHSSCSPSLFARQCPCLPWAWHARQESEGQWSDTRGVRSNSRVSSHWQWSVTSRERSRVSLASFSFSPQIDCLAKSSIALVDVFRWWWSSVTINERTDYHSVLVNTMRSAYSNGSRKYLIT